MIKKVFCILAILLVCLSTVPQLTDQEIVRQLFNGLFAQNNLPQPNTILSCIDDKSAHQIVVFVPQALQLLVKGTVADAIALQTVLRNFYGSLDPYVFQCTKTNDQYISLTNAFGIKDTDLNLVANKIFTYIFVHLATVRKWAVDVDDSWNAGDYYQVGFKAATYGHIILGNSYIESNLRID